MKRRVELRGQPLQRQLAVAGLASRILSNGGHLPTVPLPDPPPLLVVKRRRRVDVEDGLDPRGGDVGVLASRARRTAGAKLDLAQRDREARGDPKRIVQA
jgi:hypothetical protein